MTAFQVDASEVALGAASAAQTASEISASVALMMTQLQALQGTWMGAASASFQGVIAQWQATQANVEASLQSVSQALQAASATYSDAESQATALFAGA